MKRFVILSVVGLAAVSVAVTAAVAKPAQEARPRPQVCVLLPDTKSSVRWVQFDAPDLAKALKKAGVTYSITNALNDPQKMVSQADACLSRGAKVAVVTDIAAGHVDRDREEVREGRRLVDRLRPPGRRRDREGLRHVRRQGQSARAQANGHRQAARRASRSRSSPSSGAARRTERVLVQERQRRRS